jgi:hypothetical protein
LRGQSFVNLYSQSVSLPSPPIVLWRLSFLRDELMFGRRVRSGAARSLRHADRKSGYTAKLRKSSGLNDLSPEHDDDAIRLASFD